MPKVLRIINRFNIGGPTYNAAYLSKYMPDNFETMLVGGQKDETEDSSGFILDKLDLDPIIIPEMRREIGFSDDRKAYKKIKELIAEFKPDIVHTHASKAGAIGRLAASKMKVPLIYHTFHGHVFHSYFGKAKTSAYKNIERYLAKKSTYIIAISEIQKQELAIEHKICDLDKIKVVPLGFDLNRFREDQDIKRIRFRKEWKIQSDEIAVGIIGRLVPIKNHKFFFDVCERVNSNTAKKVKFLVVGDGELGEELRELVATKNLTNVIFTSWQKEVDIVNAGLDIICLTSLNEGTPVSLIEAQASAKPIVTTNVGGVKNIIRNNKSAFCVEKDDVDGFTNQLLSLIEDEELRDEFSKNGSHVFESFHYTRLVNDISSIYNDGLSQI
ncbi:MAG: glycosyltransferase involved in cell wall biosynthesis [Parvicella sp.]|jgi:glycosyltransferase involved in cell wall biosynthesis